MTMINEKTFPNAKVSLSLFEQKIDNEKMNIKICEEIDKQGDKQNHKSNVKAQMTEWLMTNKPGFKQLADIMITMSKIIAKQKYEVDYIPVINNLWGMKYIDEDYTVTHNHWPSIFSCVYYIDPPKNAPGLFFPEFDTERKPEHGLLVMFPGWVKHGVKKKKFKGERYCVSANLQNAEYWTTIAPRDTTNK